MVKFVDRTAELKDLKEYSKLSEKRLFSAAICGQRRIGKTELVKKFCEGRKYLYFFVYEGKTRRTLLNEFTEELKKRKVIEEEVYLKSFDEFLDLLFKKCSGYVIVFDEVQFMHKIYPAFFSILQRNFDERKDARIFFIFLGSIIGLVKKVFEDEKAPLYDRIKAKINLKPLDYCDVREMLAKLDYRGESRFIEFHAFFGGIPKYYVAIEDFEMQGKTPIEVVESFFLRKNAPFGDEVLSILRQEFGARKSYYYSILEAIATGHTKLSEIASYTGIDQTSLTPFMRDLVEYYELVRRKTPVTEKGRSKKGIYALNNNLFKFWFNFVHRNISEYEIGNYDAILRRVREEFDSFVGRAFEGVAGEALQALNKRKQLPFVFDRIGGWWGAHHDERTGERKTAEIDVVALSESTREILFAECKWQGRRLGMKAVRELEGKAELVDWHAGRRREYYALFSKSGFDRKVRAYAEEKNAREKKWFLYDLKDLEKIFKEK